MNTDKSCLVVVIAIVIISLLVVLFSKCTSYATTGTLKVDSNISKVNISLGDTTYQTPFELELKKGDYTLQAFRAGYLDKQISVTIKARQTTTINVELDEDPIDKETPEGAP